MGGVEVACGRHAVECVAPRGGGQRECKERERPMCGANWFTGRWIFLFRRCVPAVREDGGCGVSIGYIVLG